MVSPVKDLWLWSEANYSRIWLERMILLAQSQRLIWFACLDLCQDSLVPHIQRVKHHLKMKWIGLWPPLCTYRLNWARRTSWGWWDEWDDTVLQTQNSKFALWRSEAEHATSRSRRLPTIMSFTRGWGRNIFVSIKKRRDREPNPVKGSGANHYPRAPAPNHHVGPSLLQTCSPSNFWETRARFWKSRVAENWWWSCGACMVHWPYIAIIFD